MDKFTELFDKKNLISFSYILLTALMVVIFWLIGQDFNINRFLELTEAGTYDLRLKIPINKLKPNPNVIFLTIDEDSLEKMQDEFGSWTWDRSAYKKIIDYLESGGVDSIAFDIMFLAHKKGFEKNDIEFARTVGKYPNVYLSMSLDDRKNKYPPSLSNDLKVNIENQDSRIDYSTLEWPNCRLIYKELLESTTNIGMINFKRNDDGISRQAPLFVKYRGDFYPYLAFRVAYEYLKKHENLDTSKFIINKKGQLILGKRKIQLDKEGLMIINWYGPDGTFTRIPFWEVIKSYNDVKRGKKPSLPASYFKDKVVFVGATATALYDLKSVPLSSYYPGTEIQVTIFNNLIDENPVTRIPLWIDILACIFLSVITGLAVIRLKSVFTSSLAALAIAITYITFTSFLLKYYFIWMGVVVQIILIVLTFTIMYIIKYLIKSRDLEYTYKLATTDGLTNLYNHRYFQEQLASSIETAKRYASSFSLLLIDIDFFKKFNDSYGHQAGDAVLRQVADLLKKNVRTSDLVARYGGEEMAIILSNTNLEEAIITANKICNAVAEKSFRLSETIERNVTISLGVATYPQHGEVPSTLIEFADKGLYFAKGNGRNQVGIAKSPEDTDSENTDK